MALWDIAGKVAGLPIHRLIGTYRDNDRRLCQLGDPRLEPRPMRKQAPCIIKSTGWPAYKIHPPQRWREDIKVCEAVRKAVGDDFTDHARFDLELRYEEALRVGLAIEEMGFYWYEDPLADAGHLQLRQAQAEARHPDPRHRVPDRRARHAYAPWIMSRATDFLRGDVAVKGGITTLIKTAHLAEALPHELTRSTTAATRSTTSPTCT